MKRFLLALAFFSLPAAAQDAGRGKLVYETQCDGCHYARLHERERSNSRVQSLADLRDQVVLRAGQTGRPFTLEDLEDLVEYLNRSYYRFGLEPSGARELIYGAELMSAAEREQYRREVAAAGASGQDRVRERYRQRVRARAKERGVELAEPHGIVGR